VRITDIQFESTNCQETLTGQTLTRPLNVIHLNGREPRNAISDWQLSLLCCCSEKKEKRHHSPGSPIRLKLQGNGDRFQHSISSDINTQYRETLQQQSEDRRKEKLDIPTSTTTDRRLETICELASDIMFAPANDDLALTIKSYESLTQISSSSTQMCVNSSHCEPEKPTTQYPVRRSLATNSVNTAIDQANQYNLKSELARIEREIANLGVQNFDAERLLERRNHLTHRLSNSTPVDCPMPNYRSEELGRELEQLRADFSALDGELTEKRQQLTVLELDLDHCRPAMSSSSSKHQDATRKEHQQLCILRDRVLRELSKLNRKHVQIESSINFVIRRLEKHNSQSRRLDLSQEAYIAEQRSIEIEINRIDHELQSTEKAERLNADRQILIQGIQQSERLLRIEKLIDTGNHWLGLLSNQPQLKMKWLQQPNQDGERVSLNNCDLDLAIDKDSNWRPNQRQKYLASLALRLAAGQHLHESSLTIPLIITTPPASTLHANSLGKTLADERSESAEMDSFVASQSEGNVDNNCDELSDVYSSIANALATYAECGLQTIVLTNDHRFSCAIGELGGCVAEIESKIDQPPTETPNRNPLLKKLSGFPQNILDQLTENQITTVADLFNTSEKELLAMLQDDPESLTSIQEIRNTCKLVYQAPKLTWFDAQILIGSGIRSIEQLRSTTPTDLLVRTEDFLLTPRGQSCLASGDASELCRLLTWLAATHRRKDLQPSSLSPDTPKPERIPGDSVTPTAKAQAFGSLTKRQTERTQQTTRELPRALTNHCKSGVNSKNDLTNLRNEVTANRASIAGQTSILECKTLDCIIARRLSRLNYRTVADFIGTQPEKISDELGNPRIQTKLIVMWQNQARLCIRIRHLSAEQSRLLVLSGLDDPDVIATSNVDEIIGCITGFTSSTRGKRQARGIPIPSSADILNWIDDCRFGLQRIAA